MGERTDGPQRNAGAGPKPIALASGIASESKLQAAYRAWLDHMQDCGDCRVAVFKCPAAAALWKLYREARG